MDTSFTPEELAFQDEVRQFIADNYPAELKANTEKGIELEKEDFLKWYRILVTRGWVAPSWPEE